MLKPRASSLLAFISVCAAIIAGDGLLSPKLPLIAITVLLGSAGANGLTNYLDRDFDARMQRTRHRVLPSKRIYPPEKVLPLTIGLVIIGLVLAWRLHPFSFIAGLIGTIAALTWRKRATCIFPQGILAGGAPVLIGWFAIKPAFSWELLLLYALVAVWLPLHVWSVMLAHREDYITAGLNFFPMSRETGEVAKVLLAFNLVLSLAAITLYFVAEFGWLYLIIASLLTVAIIYASLRLVISSTSKNGWRLYKLSAFPYLGLIFLVMCLDLWLV